MTDIIPPYRTPEALIAAVDVEHLETNPLYTQGRIQPGTTWCNLAAHNIMGRLGVTLPFLIVNKQGAWLREDSNEWRQCDAVEAYANANEGIPTLAIWEGKTESHGHIAVLIPSSTLPPDARDQIAIAQSGKHNFSRGRLSNGFDSLPVLFFTHP